MTGSRHPSTGTETLADAVGRRLRTLRAAAGLSQERLAEKAGVHSTYIGQVERGQKNVTIDSLSRIIKPLGVSLSEFFETFDDSSKPHDNPPHRCYELLAGRPPREQEALHDIVYQLVSLIDAKR